MKIIVFDYTNICCIKIAEKKKTALENKGYSLIKTLQIGLNKFKLVYEDLN